VFRLSLIGKAQHQSHRQYQNQTFFHGLFSLIAIAAGLTPYIVQIYQITGPKVKQKGPPSADLFEWSYLELLEDHQLLK
jgi:hypothetical protein